MIRKYQNDVTSRHLIAPAKSGETGKAFETKTNQRKQKGKYRTTESLKRDPAGSHSRPVRSDPPPEASLASSSEMAA